MLWHITLIDKMYTQYLESTAPQYLPDSGSFIQLLKNVDTWISSSQGKTSLGVAITLLSILEKRLGTKEVITLPEFIKILIGAYMLSWKTMDDCAIHAKDFLQKPSTNFFLPLYDLDFLIQAEASLIKEIQYNIHPHSIESSISLIKKYCDQQTYPFIIEDFWYSTLLNSTEYAIEALNQKSDGTSVKVYEYLLKCAQSGNQIKQLLMHLNQRASDDLKKIARHRDRIIITAQERVLELTPHHPYDESDFRYTLDLPATNKEQRLEKFTFLIKLSHRKLPDWYIQHILNTLKKYQFTYPLFYDEKKYDIFDAVSSILRSIPLTPEEKKLTIILFSQHFTNISNQCYVSATDIYVRILACIVTAIKIRSTQDINNILSIQEVFNLKIPKGYMSSVATQLQKNYMGNESNYPSLNNSNLLQFCFELFKNRKALETNLLVEIKNAASIRGHILALKILNCVTTTEQLDQIMDAFSTLNWPKHAGHLNAFYKTTPVKEQLQMMRTIMQEMLKSPNEKALETPTVAPPR